MAFKLNAFGVIGRKEQISVLGEVGKVIHVHVDDKY